MEFKCLLFLSYFLLSARSLLNRQTVRPQYQTRLNDQPSKYITPALEKRLQDGILTSGDLERMFGLSVRQTDRILQETNKPFNIGVIVSLESALVDMAIPTSYAFAALCSEIGKSTPEPAAVKETVGLTFTEALVPLGWATLPPNVIPKAEARYYDILSKILAGEMFPLRVRPGAAQLLEQLLADPLITLTIFTSLPRQIAISALSRTRISNILEGRIGASRLIYPDTTQWADRKDGQQYVRACAEMRQPPMVCISVDSNPKKLIQAKRMGICTQGIREGCMHPVQLRHSDRVLDTLQQLSVKDLYALLRRNVELSNGMKAQVAAAGVRVPTDTVKLIAPAMEDGPRPRDTFADEYKSDIL